MTRSRDRFNEIVRFKLWIGTLAAMLALIACLGWTSLSASAQTAGEGSMQGTVTDSTGAMVPNATITITNSATGVQTVRTATNAGFFNISPVLPGTYTVQVASKGFQTLVQQNVVVDALQVRTINPVLSVGAATQTVTVTGAPPVLDTADATISTTMENSSYTNLPLQMNGQQRDPTAFGTLTPGAQAGARLPVIGGTGNYLGQLYLDGMPAETVSQQGDNRLVSLTMSVEAVDQFQVLSSTPPAEYMGAGAENFTMKSGGKEFHGQASDFIRNTEFDAWSFTNKWATVKNAQGLSVPAPKPPEHQNELSLSLGGRVPHTGNKAFFFVAYDKYHYRYSPSPQLYTIPTDLMRNGDFTELNGNVGSGGQSGTGASNPALLFDPMTNSCAGNTCSRSPFTGAKSGVATNNVIPSADISPIALAMEKALPEPSNPSVTTNNYLGSVPKGFDNHVTDWRVDYDISSNHRISSIGTIGVENYLNNYGTGGTGATSYGYLPLPYIGGDFANIYPKNYIVEDAYTINPNLVNQLKYSFTRFFQNIANATQGVANYAPGKFGITNLPAGQAGQEFPGAQFQNSGGLQLTGWTQNGNSAATQLTTPNNFALTDNVQWLRGKHALTFGLTFQWQEINNANPATYTGVLSLAYNNFSTANFASGANSLSGSNGYSYASYLLGAVAGSTANNTSAPSLGLQTVSEEGGRYKVISPYVQDSYKITSKLTLDLGLRWDYLPPYHEVKNHWTFLNPNLTNPLTNSAGMLQFAGNYGGPGVSCGCKTPVQTYWKNFGPRVGLAYSINPKTVVRAGFAQVFSQGGGVGGRGGAFNGTGQTGFNTSIIGPTENGTGVAAGPSYWLNSNSAYLGAAANTGLFAGLPYPAPPTPSVAAQELSTGFYLNSSSKLVSASSVSYADPYYSGRAPEIELFNFGIERGITQDLTLAINYVGNESHFLINSTNTGTGNARGYWTNQVNPKYLALLAGVTDSTGTKPLLTSQATAANVAILQKAIPSAPTPAFFTAAGVANGSATIAQMLTPFPQYSGVSDTWGNVGNFNYHSLQVTLQQRMAHGLTFNVNYTFAKNIGDDGPYRDGYDIPAAAISHGTRAYKQDRIDRSWTTLSIPSTLHVYGVYQLPFGQGHMGSNSMLVRWLAGGWQFSGIYQYSSGTPLQLTWGGCNGTNCPAQGQNMPDLAQGYSGKPRLNGKYGSGPNGVNACNLGAVSGCKPIPYIDVSAFANPQNVSTVSTPQYLIGNAPRTAPYGLRNPSFWEIDSGLRRAFPLHFEHTEFVFEADCINVWNNVIFAGPSGSWSSGSATFGTITGLASNNNPRDWQFAGHINF
ncbi:MAG TPA: TonB-dependent receptor [Terracidiphilus sp.]|nr:TonB-dependent receptor [Terracidiphilus sp.]